MRNRTRLFAHALILLFALVNVVNAADQSFGYEFLGNPLLVLAVLLVVDAIALVYHRIKK